MARTRVDVPVSALRRARRAEVGAQIAHRHDGVARRADLIAAGLTDHDISCEINRGVWHRAGTHTVCIEGMTPRGRGLLWWALWESGPRSVLDGVSALLAAGLRHWDEPVVHVSVPKNATVRKQPGIEHHLLRDLGPRFDTGLRRTRPEVAVVRAAQWATSDRAAATIVAMTVQQRLASVESVRQRWTQTRYSSRRPLLDLVVGDVCDGAHSMTEIDVAAACRARGLPEPTRQYVRSGRRGRVYLDVLWEEHRVHAEIQGAHHLIGLTGVDDALRGNDVAIGLRGLVSLQIPVLGWRLQPDAFLDQIALALGMPRGPHP